MRRLWVAAWVSRSVARTRRSSAARAASGSCSGCSPAGSTSGSRARVSASMPLDLAWRDSTRRRSWALAELTRYTMWPRAAKNTAIGSHAGPVGSTTTSRRVPAGVSARAACSTCSRLSTGGDCLAAADQAAVAGQHPDGMGAGDPTVDPDQPSLVHLVASLAAIAGCSGRFDGRRSAATVPRSLRPTTAPLMCCNRPRPRWVGPLPSSGASVAGQGRQSDERGSAHQRLPQRRTQRHPRNQPGCACNPGTLARIKHRGPLHEDSNAPRRSLDSGATPSSCLSST
ncbi:MAG: hypothetical protein K0S88_134 [Actinomycetia bacterium]|nr:hypothetical protein [Actinomycetes bacterium]